MQCHEFELSLEQSAFERLPADAAAHLDDCGQCRALVSDLEAIQAAARQLPAEVNPPERVWVSLRAQLEAENLIRKPVAGDREIAEHPGWFAWLPRPALASAFLSVLLATAVLIGVRSDFRRQQYETLREPQPATTLVASQLTAVEHHTVSALRPQNPAITASLRENLDIVDNFIALCEKSVREEPQNQLAREYLFGAYQQKADLLAAMMDRGAVGD